MSDHDELVRQVRSAIRGGDLLAAYDLALHGLAEHADSLELRYLSVLSLARAGATEFAARRFLELGLDHAEGSGQLAVDLPALQGRLAKDRALAATGARQRVLLRQAAEAYERAFAKTTDAYPLVNAAVLRLWAGDQAMAREHGQEVLRLLAGTPLERRDYWHFATKAEAELISGDVEAARAALAAGAVLAKDTERPDWLSLSVTAAQLRRTCRMLGVDEGLIAPLRMPPVAVYGGDRPGARLAPEAEARFGEAIAARLRTDGTAIGFGGLAAGGEIMLAEALLDVGAELNLVLALPTVHYVALAVAPYGSGWVERFERCVGKARSVEYATDYGYEGDVAPLRYAARIAMGRGILRSRALDAEAEHLWLAAGGESEDVDASHDLSFWARGGRSTRVIREDSDRKPRWRCWRPGVAKPASAAPEARPARVNAAILFGDIHGFSKLAEKEIPAYVATVLGTIGDILDRYARHLLARNSWGDAVVAEFDDVLAAARCAIEIQGFFQRLDHAKAGLSNPMTMRIGLHYGPVQRLYDKVQERDNYMGAHVVRAARIEPVAIPGMIYVSAAFAAALAVAPEAGLACDYLGNVDMAKGYGVARLYALRATADHIEAPSLDAGEPVDQMAAPGS